MPTHEFDNSNETHEDQGQYHRQRCRHIFTAGRRCGSPCLRGEQFCYFHHTTRRPVHDPRSRANNDFVYNLPNPEDRDSIRTAVAQVMQAVARNNVDMKRAGMLLYSLQIALNTLPPQPRPASLKTIKRIPVKDFIEDLVIDEAHGVIAPIAELEEMEDEDDEYDEDRRAPRRSLARQLLDTVEEYEAKQAAEAAQQAMATAAFEEGRATGMKLNEQTRLDSDDNNPHPGTIIDIDASASPLNRIPRQPHSHRATRGRVPHVSILRRGTYTASPPDTPNPPKLGAGCPSAGAPSIAPLSLAMGGLSSPESSLPNPPTKKCHPERSGSQLHRDPRSRRTCVSLTPPQPPEPLSPICGCPIHRAVVSRDGWVKFDPKLSPPTHKKVSS